MYIFQVGVRTEGIQEAILKMKDENSQRIDKITQIVKAVRVVYEINMMTVLLLLLILMSSSNIDASLLILPPHSFLGGGLLLRGNHWPPCM